MSDPAMARGAALLAQVRADTLALIVDLESEMTSIAQSTAESPDDEHDAEGSTIGFERARVRGLLVRTRRSLAEIDAALERIRVGSYGLCHCCGGHIAPDRLLALPATLSCVECAVSRE
ncbi:MAG: TraR/DksA family transcriptional regulator [Acidimicrobiales bacterium]